MSENWDHKRTFTAEEIREAVQGAVDNWDWAEGDEMKISRLNETARMADEIVEQQGDGETFTLDRAYNNVWDWLHERSVSAT